VKGMPLARFVLVHGGYHGAWCWNRLLPELAALGHDALAIDLPGAGARFAEKATLASWRAALAEVIETGDVLVGHSLGGFAISIAADEVPEKVGRLVYLSASVPVEDATMREAAIRLDTDWSATSGRRYENFVRVIDTPEQGPCTVVTDPAAAGEIFYHDCSPQEQAWAFEQLTPMSVEVTTTPVSVPRFWTAPIPRDYILCTDDRTHPVASDNASMRRLGLSVCGAISSSHSPFLSRPSETARLLHACASGVFQAHRAPAAVESQG
jgi:pimeloyl-ACP methyl ester carboxylesterase